MIEKLKAKWTQFKAWSVRQYRKVVAFMIALLVGVGAMSYAETRDITFEHPTQRIDGTALALAEIAETRLYCDGELTAVIPAPATSVTHDFGIGNHTCHATTVDTFDQESDPSNSVNFLVTPARPGPPTIALQ